MLENLVNFLYEFAKIMAIPFAATILVVVAIRLIKRSTE